jgi:hypothetical protein
MAWTSEAGQTLCIIEGGARHVPAVHARTANRSTVVPDQRSEYLGVLPARALR